jgi:hypothetical protein
VEQQAADAAASWSPGDFLAAVRKGIWKELDATQVKVDACRRNLQHAYLDLANVKINGSAPSLPAGLPAELLSQIATGSSADEKPLYRAELRALNASVVAALGKTADRETRAHLEGARDQIAKILDPKFAPASGSTGTTIRVGLDGIDPFSAIPDSSRTCWPDYIIPPY